MALSFELGFNPKWYFVDMVGRPLGGGYFATFSSLNHSILNPVFTDETGVTTWPYVSIPNVGSLGVLIDENGTQGPFYFQFNSAVPDQLYYLEVYDSTGVLQWTIDDYSPQVGSGGGTIITTAYNITNFITNNIMLRNQIGYTPVACSNFMRIAPGAHAGLALTGSNAGPDIVFLKNGTGATDTLSFVKFDIGETFPNGDPTPVDYLEYNCTGAGSSETLKCVMFPITHGVQNIQNQTVTLTIMARCTGGTASTLTLNWFQFFGDGPSASSSSAAAIQVLNLTSAWQKFVITTTVPSTTGMFTGECGNDGLFIQVQFPFTATTTIDFTQLSGYMGSIAPGVTFTPNDAIESVMYTPRTGYTVMGYDLNTMGGYFFMNDTSIGSASSGATGLADISAFPLYNLLYNTVSNSYAPVPGRTGNAVNDFVNGLPLTVPRMLGRALAQFGTGAGLGSSWAIGQYFGEVNHVLTVSELAAHAHAPIVGSGFRVQTGGGGTVDATGGTQEAIEATTANAGGGGAHNNTQPTSFAAVFIKL